MDINVKKSLKTLHQTTKQKSDRLRNILYYYFEVLAESKSDHWMMREKNGGTAYNEEMWLSGQETEK